MIMCEKLRELSAEFDGTSRQQNQQLPEDSNQLPLERKFRVLALPCIARGLNK